MGVYPKNWSVPWENKLPPSTVLSYPKHRILWQKALLS